MCVRVWAYYRCLCGCVWMQVCARLCSIAVVFVFQGGIYLFVHKCVEWSICVIYEMVFICMWLRLRACVCVCVLAYVCIHILAQLHREYTVLWCVTDRVMCLSAADAVHIWWETQPTVCGLIWHGMIQAITHTQRHPLAHSASMVTRPLSHTQECAHIHTLAYKHTYRKTY